jgi:hypothetical protein
MDTQHFAILKAEIIRDLEPIEKLQNEMNESLANFDFSTISDFNLRAIGSILHDFYTAIERIFRRISQNLDGELPLGENWHTQLLDRMTLNIPEVRIPVISKELKSQLHELLRFRHVFRNVYGYELKARKIEPLARKINKIAPICIKELNNFVDWLQSLMND